MRYAWQKMDVEEEEESKQAYVFTNTDVVIIDCGYHCKCYIGNDCIESNSTKAILLTLLEHSAVLYGIFTVVERVRRWWVYYYLSRKEEQKGKIENDTFQLLNSEDIER